LLEIPAGPQPRWSWRRGKLNSQLIARCLPLLIASAVVLLCLGGVSAAQEPPQAPPPIWASEPHAAETRAEGESVLATVWSDQQPERVVGAALSALILAVAVLGFWRGIRADAAWRAQGVLYPVSPRKFLLLSFLTLGLYTALWFWKNWRWVKAHDRPEITPFMRAMFSIFFVYPLFKEASRRAGAVRYPKWIGVVSAIGFVGSSLFSGTFVETTAENLASVVVYALLPSACLLPTVLTINGANPPETGVLAANSRFSAYTWAAVVGGLLFWVLATAGAFA
jgi:hypothetical protein